MVRHVSRVVGLVVGVVIFGACGGSDGLTDEGLVDSEFCDAALELAADPLNHELASEAAGLAGTEEQRRAFSYQAELARLVTEPDYEAGDLPDWNAIGFEAEPTLDDIAAVVDRANRECAGLDAQ